MLGHPAPPNKKRGGNDGALSLVLMDEGQPARPAPAGPNPRASAVLSRAKPCQAAL